MADSFFKKKDDEIDLAEVFKAIKRRGKLVAKVTLSFLFLSTFLSVIQRIYFPTYTGKFSILIKDPIDSKSSSISDRKTENPFSLLALNKTETDIKTLISFLKSETTLESLIKKYNINPDNIEIKLFEVGRKKEIAKGILDVILFHRSIKEGEIILNDLSNAYINIALKQKQKSLSNGINFLDSQIPSIKQKTLDLENKLALFRSKNSSFDPNLEGAVITNKEADISRNLKLLETEKVKLKKIKEEIANNKEKVISFTELYGSQISKENNPVISDQFSPNSTMTYRPFLALEKAEDELAEAKLTYLPNSKTIKRLKANVNYLKPIAIQSAIDLNKERYKYLLDLRSEIEGKAENQYDLIAEYNSILQDLLLTRENLGGILEARTNLKFQLSQSAPPWQIINLPKMKSKPVSPSFPKNIAIGTLIGLLSGIAIGLYRDKKDNVFHSIEEVKNDIQIAHLAHIPYVKIFNNLRESGLSIFDQILSNESQLQKSNLKEDQYQRFFYQEALRTLYTSLRFLNAENKIKIITLTSSIPAEGKSVINILLSKTISDLGERILLIDCDLRRPTLHKKLGINNLRGLSNLITDKELEISEVIQTVPNYKNWDVITAGIKPPDPTRLLASESFSKLCKNLASDNKYDLIIFDTPPVGAISDASLVAENSDGIILLISLNNVDKAIPKQSIKKLLEGKSSILGIITNSTTSKGYSLGSSENDSYINTYASYSNDEEYNQASNQENVDTNDLISKKSKILEKFVLKFKAIISWFDN